MSSEKQGPSFYLNVLSYNFCVFLPLFKERRKEIEGVQEHFFQRKKCHLFPERVASSTDSALAGSCSSILFSVLWVHVGSVL